MRLSEAYRGYRDSTLPGLQGLSETARASEFAVFLQRGLKTDMLNAYQEFIGPVERLLKRVSSAGAFETWPKIGALDTIDERMASGEFVHVGFNSEDVSLVNIEYGGMLSIDRYLIDTDQTNKIKAQATKMGESAARKKDTTTYGLFNNGATTDTYDAVFLFAAVGAAHPCVTGGSADTANTNSLALGGLSEANWETMLTTVNGWKGIYGEYLMPKVTACVTGNTSWFTAQRLFGDPVRVPAAATTYGHAKNIFNGTAEVIHHPRLTAASWYAKTSIDGFLLQVLTALEMTQEADNAGLSFQTRTYNWRVYEAYKIGAIEWRNYCKGN